MTAENEAIAAFIARVRAPRGTWRVLPLPGPDRDGAHRVRVQERVEEAEVTLYERDGSLAVWRRPALAERAKHAVLDVADAIAVAKPDAEPPSGGESSVDFVLPDPGSGVVRVAWKHLHHGVWVEPDHIMATLDPTTKRVCALSRRWSVVPPEAGIPED